MVAKFQSAQTKQGAGDERGAASSESSGDDDDDDEGQPAARQAPDCPDYENIAPCSWRSEDRQLVQGLPFRSRAAVYSPTSEPPDLHNDSGYSTKLYGSSKGPSPSLSGQMDCDSALPSQQSSYGHKAEQVHAIQRKTYDCNEDPGANTIVTASLV